MHDHTMNPHHTAVDVTHSPQGGTKKPFSLPDDLLDKAILRLRFMSACFGILATISVGVNTTLHFVFESIPLPPLGRPRSLCAGRTVRAPAPPLK